MGFWGQALKCRRCQVGCAALRVLLPHNLAHDQMAGYVTLHAIQCRLTVLWHRHDHFHDETRSPAYGCGSGGLLRGDFGLRCSQIYVHKQQASAEGFEGTVWCCAGRWRRRRPGFARLSGPLVCQLSGKRVIDDAPPPLLRVSRCRAAVAAAEKGDWYACFGMCVKPPAVTYSLRHPPSC